MERIAVPVPRFVAVGMVSAFPQSSYSALISLTGDRFKTFGYHAYTLLKVEKEPRERLVPALQYLFTLLRRMHDHGFYHGDVNLGNILFDAAQKEFRFIDFHRSNSWGMGRTRDRTVDLSKVHHFLLDYFSRDEWFDLAREPYFRNDERLEMRVKSIWESVTRERMQGKAENIAREAIEGKRRFSVEQCEGYRVHSYRYGGYSPIELVQMVKTGRFPDKVHLLDTPASFRAAKKKWIELVRKTTLHPNGANPLALIGDKNSRSTLLIKEGPPPPYSLPQVFSLERFKQR
jgi:serine/threonine protein kinase